MESMSTILKRRPWGLRDIQNQLVHFILEKQCGWIYQYSQNCPVLSTTTKKTKEKDMEILKGISDKYAATQILLTKDTCLHYYDSFSKEEDHLYALCQNETETQENDVLKHYL